MCALCLVNKKTQFRSRTNAQVLITVWSIGWGNVEPNKIEELCTPTKIEPTGWTKVGSYYTRIIQTAIKKSFILNTVVDNGLIILCNEKN